MWAHNNSRHSKDEILAAMIAGYTETRKAGLGK
jgi:hypothetical protein